jgi:acyl-CoA synthetase (AMP-forming)/AMP-acid ligase II
MPPALVDRFTKMGCAFASPRGRPLMTAAFAEIYGMVELSGPAILKVTPPTPFGDGPISAPAKRALAQVSARLTRTRALASRVRAAVGTQGAPEGKSAGDALGIPIPPYRARVVDENGKRVKAGVVGELVLKGPGVTKGYDGDAAATAKTTQDGWLKTGDLAWQNRLGLIAFATRKKDVVKHGGFSVFPAEVEAQMSAHAAIAECVVFGLPHSTKGAVPAAAVVLAKGAHATELELLAWARDHIAPFKAPRAIAIVASADIPRNANKKVLKDDLRAMLVTRGALVTAASG